MTLTQGVKQKAIRSRNIIKPKTKRIKVKKELNIGEMIVAASDCIAPSWGLKTFIARNPLHGLTRLPFAKAIEYYYSARSEENRSHVNRLVAKWCHAFFDLGESSIQIPNKEKGFYRAWLSLVKYDHELNKDKVFLKTLPASPECAIRLCMKNLRLEENRWIVFFRSELLQLKGWASYVKEKRALLDFLAVRLATLCLTTKDRPLKIPPGKREVPFDLSKTQLKEKLYEEQLLRKLSSTITRKQAEDPEAQLIFCIDTRSESMRKRIEESGPYETFGCAGFFGLPVEIDQLSKSEKTHSCPVIVKPEHTIQAEVPDTPLDYFKKIYADLKSQFGTSFSLVETVGAWCVPAMIWRVITPFLTRRTETQKVKYDFSSISLRKQAEYAEKFLKSIGLTSKFSQWIVICGHGSETTNNLYASSLDCGACGGNHGGANAQVMAAMLNSVEVRLELSEKGIFIPLETTFISAEHNTTTDHIQFLEQTKEDETLRRLRYRLVQAGQVNTRSRLGVSHHQEAVKNSRDWSAVRPEWGLAKNASFIVAKRSMTYGIDLESRTFLHSYEWDADTDGSILESILLGPVFVAHWINAQYFFSTIDHSNFGAGSKIFHNLTGKLGVVKGNGGDLMEGLPLESVNKTQTQAFHEPQRLLVLINAPLAKVKTLVDKHQNLRELIDNQWIFLKIIDPLTQETYSL